jgi:hypothetical protein
VPGAFAHLRAQATDRPRAGRFNLSKAYRRLKSFADYQEKYFDEFFADPVLDTDDGVKATNVMMPMQVPAWTCKAGNVMWILDTKQMVWPCCLSCW